MIEKTNEQKNSRIRQPDGLLNFLASHNHIIDTDIGYTFTGTRPSNIERKEWSGEGGRRCFDLIYFTPDTR